MTVAIGLESCEQLVHFGFGEVLTDPIEVIGLAACRFDWSHIRRTDELEVRRFHWMTPMFE